MSSLQGRFSRFVASAVATVLGVGLCPIAPGTAGSAVPATLVYFFVNDPRLNRVILYALLLVGMISVPSIEVVLDKIKEKWLSSQTLHAGEGERSQGADSVKSGDSANMSLEAADCPLAVADASSGETSNSLAALDYNALKRLIDPRSIVIDEVVGQLLCYLIVSAFYPLSRINVLVGFVAFRFFDILKPWPIRKVERAMEKIPSIWSISVVVDDIFAGGMAAAVVLIGMAFLSRV
jgi:phosphatidylglycerophosphatase A